MTLPLIIQGGMGVAVSNWRLARTVSKLGHLGVVSGTGMARVLIARLADGDPDGRNQRALEAFPYPEVAERIFEKYYIPGGKDPGKPYKASPPYTLEPADGLDELTVVSNFVEVYLAKEGHDGVVGINLLEKVQMPNTSSLYGALLADVDYVLMGAGIPIQIPGILDKLAEHRHASYRVDVLGATKDDDFRIHFDPEKVFPGISEMVGPLKRAAFLPIISSVVLAQAMIKRSEGSVEGFIIEGPLAGGHNAPPRGNYEINDLGEPMYSAKDEVDLEKIARLGLPFWLAGNYGKADGLQKALEAGAAGIQVGTLFAYCNESGMAPDVRQKVLSSALRGDIKVLTNAVASPTGFPFKVVQMDGTMSDHTVYEERRRVCDIGYLRHLYKQEDGSVGYRCPSEPEKEYVKKGGKLEDTVGRACLCNHLAAAAGLPQTRHRGTYTEKPVVTSGNALEEIHHFVQPGESSYSAEQVINYLMEGVSIPEPA